MFASCAGSTRPALLGAATAWRAGFTAVAAVHGRHTLGGSPAVPHDTTEQLCVNVLATLATAEQSTDRTAPFQPASKCRMMRCVQGEVTSAQKALLTHQQEVSKVVDPVHGVTVVLRHKRHTGCYDGSVTNHNIKLGPLLQDLCRAAPDGR